MEFDRNKYCHGFKFCLIQVYGNGKCHLIDPLTNLNLEPLYKIFENNKILKVFHNPQEDLKLLHLQGCYPKNLFDTEACTKLLNSKHTSLSNLL